MDERFFEFYPRPDGVLDEIWRDGIVVLDTNTLLNVYKMSRPAQSEIMGLLQHSDIQNRLWIPSQVYEEFLRNRETVIKSVKGEFGKAKQHLTAMKAAMDSNG